ncbi:ABC-type uncharacterized transport system ATPase subunit [Mycoplasmoides fastidiosum]|uniref:ABC-type uncharacterized transport system ATPase subunit n=1 Tax=Mycoplasmoides fastidiosum TaxID=92758 RepID=A0ABU0M042_9BACT|nr:ABC transporter ATP-binding protein [Mycoplasmoides fastidiosum]MDQ0514309.1 ABC-type uncharacterized transport system ATPase subunit [Mycoplasmoides fastidiosum]UUD38087.1 ABC transporter ATP-binding protein [Mycoplasmoides fastidiosum]
MNQKQYAVEFVDLTKEFNGFVANHQINLQIEKGKIFALIGENGAGKSTLMSVLFGLYNPTYGYIKINGERIEIQDPNHANDLKIGMVHQHFKLVEDFTNLENIILGSEFEKNRMLYREPAIKKIQALQAKYRLHFDLNQKTGDATVSTQQKVEIMKMLYRNSDILIFDEPTAVLNPQEIDGLLETMLEFKKANKTIIFISHKLNELKKVADSAAVIRLGQIVLKIPDFQQVDLKTVSHAMVGANLVESKNTQTTIDSEVFLSFENVSTKGVKKLQDVSFQLQKGEILAIAGVEGNGQELIEFIIAGLVKPKTGAIKFYDPQTQQLVDITKKSIHFRQAMGLSYIPNDRQKYGLVLDFNIFENTIIRRLKDKTLQFLGIIKNRELRQFYHQIATQYDVRGDNQGQAKARALSGGNQQKAIVGRELLTPHHILLVCQPTRGLDVGAIQNIHQALLKDKAQNKAILLISYELDEVLALADSVAVINNGTLSPKIPISQVSREMIGSIMTGINKTKN